MHHQVEPRRAKARSLLVGQPKQSDEHRRHQVGVGDLALLDRVETRALVPLRHDENGRTVALVVDREHQRRRVIHRPGDEVRTGTVQPHRLAVALLEGQGVAHRGLRGALHSLGTSGGAAGVDHVPAGWPSRIERHIGSAGERAVELLPGDHHRRR